MVAEGTRLLVFGAGGQVGGELPAALAGLGEITTVTRGEADFSVPESLRAVVRRVRPHVIVNAAAYTAVDRAETEAELALRVNGVAPGVLAQEAAGLGALLIHYSTDYVFDGRQAEPYREQDATAPLSVYGSSKLAGERAVAAHCRRFLVLRTCWVMAAHGANFLRTMLRLASERDRLRVVADQYGAPTAASLIARVSADLVRQMSGAGEEDPRWGIYHLAAGGETSWFGYARYLIGRARERGWVLRAGPESIEAIATADYPTAAKRPANSRLDTTRLRAVFGVVLPPWEQGVDQVLTELRGRPSQ